MWPRQEKSQSLLPCIVGTMQPFKQDLLQNSLSEGWQKEKMVQYIWNAKDAEDVRTSKTKVKQI